MRLIPFALSAVYRFDLAYERTGIPIVPYGKLGLDYVFWTVQNGNSEVPEDASGGRGAGGTLGWHAAVGLSLVLDFFDQNGANQFDEEMGVNHTHLFFEYGHIDVSGLGPGAPPPRRRRHLDRRHDVRVLAARDDGGALIPGD